MYRWDTELFCPNCGKVTRTYDRCEHCGYHEVDKPADIELSNELHEDDLE